VGRAASSGNAALISPFLLFQFLSLQVFSERELTFTLAILLCHRLSVCLSVRLSICRLSSVTFVHSIQAIEIFGNVSSHLVPWPSIDIQVKFY